MEKTVLTIDLDKKSFCAALTRIIEHITLTPPDPDELGSKERIEYNLGLNALFSCLRQTFK